MPLPALRCSATFLFAALSLAAGYAQSDPVQDALRLNENARRDHEAVQGALKTLPPECTLGTSRLETQGKWLIAQKAEGEPNHPYVFIYSLDKARTTRALHVALNRQGLRDIEKVEIRDAAGNWSDVGPLPAHDAPDACNYVWLEQALRGTQQVKALRLSFRSGLGSITAANAGVLE
jgi:hypothetical protein